MFETEISKKEIVDSKLTPNTESFIHNVRFDKYYLELQLLKKISQITKVNPKPTVKSFYQRTCFYHEESVFSYKLSGTIKKEPADFVVAEIALNKKLTKSVVKNIPELENLTNKTKNMSKKELISSVNEILKANVLSESMLEKLEKKEINCLELNSELLTEKKIRSMLHEEILKKSPYRSETFSLHTVGGKGKKLVISCFNNEHARLEELKRRLPNYLGFTLKKTALGHFDALYKLSRGLNVPNHAIGFAGIKDKYAITFQRVSIKNITAKELQTKFSCITGGAKDRMDIGDFAYQEKATRLGDLYGNRFTIKIRNLKSESNNFDFEKMKREFEGKFVNYFGNQRFGAKNASTDKLGKVFLKRRFCDLVAHLFCSEYFLLDYKKTEEEKVLLAEGQRKVYEKIKTTDFSALENAYQIKRKVVFAEISEKKGEKKSVTKKKVHNKWAKKRVASKPYTKPLVFTNDSAEQTLLTNLLEPIKVGADARLIFPNLRDGTSFKEIFDYFPLSYKTLLVHAYQSMVWNEAASFRLAKYGKQVVCGDIIETRMDGKKTYTHITEDTIANYTLEDVVLPLVAHRIIVPKNEVGAKINDILTRDGVRLTHFSKAREFSMVSASYRKLIATVEDLEMRFEGDDLLLMFDLKSSTYATMFLREFMRNDDIN